VSLTCNSSSYNPVHFPSLEKYVQEQAKENTYDFDANLAVLKFYQFNPQLMKLPITHLILLKALTNLPFSDFVLCKYLLLPSQMCDDTVKEIIYIADILEQCDFVLFWQTVQNKGELFEKISGFYVSVLSCVYIES
jgi:translation initiation factor 3 subunit K